MNFFYQFYCSAFEQVWLTVMLSMLGPATYHHPNKYRMSNQFRESRGVYCLCHRNAVVYCGITDLQGFHTRLYQHKVFKFLHSAEVGILTWEISNYAVFKILERMVNQDLRPQYCSEDLVTLFADNPYAAKQRIALLAEQLSTLNRRCVPKLQEIMFNSFTKRWQGIAFPCSYNENAFPRVFNYFMVNATSEVWLHLLNSFLDFSKGQVLGVEGQQEGNLQGLFLLHDGKQFVSIDHTNNLSESVARTKANVALSQKSFMVFFETHQPFEIRQTIADFLRCTLLNNEPTLLQSEVVDFQQLKSLLDDHLCSFYQPTILRPFQDLFRFRSAHPYIRVPRKTKQKKAN